MHMHALVHTTMHTYTHMHVHTHAHAHAHKHTHTHAHTRLCTGACIPPAPAHADQYACRTQYAINCHTVTPAPSHSCIRIHLSNQTHTDTDADADTDLDTSTHQPFTHSVLALVGIAFRVWICVGELMSMLFQPAISRPRPTSTSDQTKNMMMS